MKARVEIEINSLFGMITQNIMIYYPAAKMFEIPQQLDGVDSHNDECRSVDSPMMLQLLDFRIFHFHLSRVY